MVAESARSMYHVNPAYRVNNCARMEMWKKDQGLMIYYMNEILDDISNTDPKLSEKIFSSLIKVVIN